MKYYFVVILSFLLFFSTKNINAQENIFTLKTSIGTTAIGGVYSDIQAGFLFIKGDGSGTFPAPSGLTSICAGVETNYLFKNDFRIVPKISFDYHSIENKIGFPLSFGLQARYYPAKDMDFSKASIQVCPQIGTNYMGMCHLYFGYNWAVTQQDVMPNLGFQANLSIFFPFGISMFN